MINVKYRQVHPALHFGLRIVLPSLKRTRQSAGCALGIISRVQMAAGRMYMEAR
jgi:hypothetical protein